MDCDPIPFSPTLEDNDFAFVHPTFIIWPWEGKQQKTEKHLRRVIMQKLVCAQLGWISPPISEVLGSLRSSVITSRKNNFKKVMSISKYVYIVESIGC